MAFKFSLELIVTLDRASLLHKFGVKLDVAINSRKVRTVAWNRQR